MDDTHTLAIIKPDAVERCLTGPILTAIEEAGFAIVAMKKVHLTKAEAETFYEVHREEPFYDNLTKYMSSGPVVIMVLEKNGVVKDFRQFIGPTDPAKAAPNTIRGRWGESIKRNVIHGSDCSESAAKEMAFFFNEFDPGGGDEAT